ncbi:MAG TPA: RES family NAD+ phosphorylase [bacterium]|nr:RES family NAD+ phosphorylase [bacterium]
MTKPLTIPHRHLPLYRIARREWADPLDASFSQRVDDNRWNVRGFPALYCCCSERVARAIVLDRFRKGNMALEDLTADTSPQLVELEWSGPVADLASDDGLAAAGFPITYPEGVTLQRCQEAAASWHEQRIQGVLCRSAAIQRVGLPAQWREPHQPWGELAIYTRNARSKPTLKRRREDDTWLHPQSPTTRASAG